MAHSPHKNWRGCAMCKSYKIRGKNRERLPFSARRRLGKGRRVRRTDLGD